MKFNEKQEQLFNYILNDTADYGRQLGFEWLSDTIHKPWIQGMVSAIVNGKPYALLAHRGSYKTTCLIVAVNIVMLLFPTIRVLLFRKTSELVKEFTLGLANSLKTDMAKYVAETFYDTPLKITRESSAALHTNLCPNVSGATQFHARGLGGSITGVHADTVVCDDISTKEDRYSNAARIQTIRTYQEIINIANPRPGVKEKPILNAGTRWHLDDIFSEKRALIKNPIIATYKDTGMLSEEQVMELKRTMSSSLFAAQYELINISEEDKLLPIRDEMILKPEDSPDEIIFDGFGHIDAAYSGTHHTAITFVRLDIATERILVFGKTWQKHVDDCADEIKDFWRRFRIGTGWCEDNADKGYLRKKLVSMGLPIEGYQEGTNKHLKISSILKGNWKNVYFINQTIVEAKKEESKPMYNTRFYMAYLEQCAEYEEGQEPDDAPDSLASLLRQMKNKNRHASKFMSDMQI